MFIVKKLLYSKNAYLISNNKIFLFSIPIWTWRSNGCVTWHTGDVSLIPNFINKTTLDKSWIPLVYENLFKTFCCCLYYSLSLSLDASLSLSLSHDVDFCDVIKKLGGGCYVIFCLFMAFRPMKLGIRLTSPVCHVTHPSATRSIIIKQQCLKSIKKGNDSRKNGLNLCTK